jgi:hypothetical protein
MAKQSARAAKRARRVPPSMPPKKLTAAEIEEMKKKGKHDERLAEALGKPGNPIVNELADPDLIKVIGEQYNKHLIRQIQNGVTPAELLRAPINKIGKDFKLDVNVRGVLEDLAKGVVLRTHGPAQPRYAVRKITQQSERTLREVLKRSNLAGEVRNARALNKK